MTGPRIQKLPMPGTISESVVMALYRAPGYELTLDQLMAILPKSVKHTLTNIATRWGLHTDVPQAYRLPTNLRRLITGESALTGAEAPPRGPAASHRSNSPSSLEKQSQRPSSSPGCWAGARYQSLQQRDDCRAISWGGIVSAPVTQWFYVVKPDLIGVYECKAPYFGGPAYRWWNGVKFGFFANSPKKAATSHFRNGLSANQDFAWRGLAINPAEEK